VTESRNVPVTGKLKIERAEEIAKKLNDTKRWRSHGRGLSMDVLRSEINLLIRDMSSDPDSYQKLRDYYRLLQDYMARRGQKIVIHSRHEYLGL
jgi:hypothetical protein